MSYLTMDIQVLLRRRAGTRNRSSTEWLAFAAASSSFMLDSTTSGESGPQ